MNLRLLAIPLLALAPVSCEKVKSLAAKATSAVKAGGKSREAGPVDAKLQALVDQTAEGAVFRMDLPFPVRLEVRTTNRHEISGRTYQSSAIEKRTDGVKGTQLAISKLESDGNKVRYTLEKSSFIIPTPDPPDGGKKKKSEESVEQVAPSVPPVTFHRSGKSWQAENRSDFRAAVLSKQLAPVFDQLLVENALAPRPMWFGKRRFKAGDQLVVTGDTLPMLLAGAPKGTLTLKLESFDAVEGHPCGVFSITGDYSRKQVPDFEGRIIDEEVTIQAGKIWCSLLYPIILRRELETIQTTRSGGQGGLVERGQGSIKVTETRVWKSLDP